MKLTALADIAAQKQKEKAAVAAKGGFVEAHPGVIRNVEHPGWTQSDERVGRRLESSSIRLQQFGRRLPTSAELLALYDRALTTPCGQWCNVSPSFRLSSNAFWSGEPSGSSRVWIVFLDLGGRISASVDGSGVRALCVRRP